MKRKYAYEEVSPPCPLGLIPTRGVATNLSTILVNVADASARLGLRWGRLWARLGEALCRVHLDGRGLQLPRRASR